jgi:hypothetical protein
MREFKYRLNLRRFAEWQIADKLTANADLALVQVPLDPSSQRYSSLAIQFKNHLRSFLTLV